MRRQRKTRLGRAIGTVEEHRDPPTPQTAARVRYDVVARLLAKHRLQPHHAAAAHEIRAVHEAVGRGMFPTSQAFEGSGRGPNRHRARDFTDRMTEGERIAWQRRYLPWSHAMATAIAAGLPGTRWLQLVIDIVVDNATPDEAERRYRLPRGAALDYLVRGLERYDGGG